MSRTGDLRLLADWWGGYLAEPRAGVLINSSGVRVTLIPALAGAADFFDQPAHPVAQTSAAAVRASIKYYRQSDHHAAARLDATYGTVEAEGDHEGARQGAGFSDVAEPADRYRKIEDYSGQFPLEPRQLATISMAGYARNIVVEATDLAAHLGFGHHWDPYEAILKPLTGDWVPADQAADPRGAARRRARPAADRAIQRGPGSGPGSPRPGVGRRHSVRVALRVADLPRQYFRPPRDQLHAAGPDRDPQGHRRQAIQQRLREFRDQRRLRPPVGAGRDQGGLRLRSRRQHRALLWFFPLAATPWPFVIGLVLVTYWYVQRGGKRTRIFFGPRTRPGLPD